MAETNVIEAEIAKGEQDNVFEEYLQSERKKMRNKLRSKMSAIRMVNNVSHSSSASASSRISELARPTKQHALNTLNEKAKTLPPKFIENLIKIVEANSCSTSKNFKREHRRKKRRTKKATRLPQSLKKEQIEEIVEKNRPAMTMDPDAAMYQYLVAERFVKSILEYQCETQESIREIADVIMKRLISIEGYSDAKNDDRTSQQLRLLADVVSRWITEILEEVIETHGEALNSYKKKRWMKRLEVSEEESEENITENWKQMDQTKEKPEETEQFDSTEATIVKKEIIDDEDGQTDENEVTGNNYF
ncbi:hypothetical protein PUN28_009910 [Cardiocondyla obscurior]|uniref:Uncharacterized protein n=2 Tax=Cardiocondyla obscurior TaxID=286306 RepID=A0AAW2FL96_9HYME